MDKELEKRGYRSSDATVFKCTYHVIFCPKYRRSVITPEIGKRFKEIVAMVAKENNFLIMEIETMPDHVHLLLDVDPAIGINVVVKWIKGRTSNILRKEFPELKRKLPTLWTRSKFISTTGAVSLEVVKEYIKDQKNK
jgi:putative transposase